MAQNAYRIPEQALPPLPGAGAHTVRVRARNLDGPGFPSAPAQGRPVSSTTARQARINGRWRDISPYALARALFALRERATFDEGEAESEASKTTALEVELNIESSARATAVEDLNVRVTAAEGTITSQASSLVSLMAEVAGKASTAALNALTTRVTAAEGTITSQASSLVSLMAEVAGKASTAALNALTTRVTAAEGTITSQASSLVSLMAEVAGKASTAALNALTTRVTAAEGNITSEAARITSLESTIPGLAQTSALDALETRVEANDNDILAVSSRTTALETMIPGLASASAVQTLETRVTQTENVDGSTTLASLARWLVQTTVNGLTAGIGLVNDGNKTRLYLNADRFAILPSGSDTSDGNGANIPFFVEGGVVYLDVARIRDLAVTGAKIANATINRLHMLAGTITADRIALGQGLVRSQRILRTTVYAPGATVSNYNATDSNVTGVEFGVIGGVDTITFRITETRRFIDADFSLEPGSVDTSHIALSATAAVYTNTTGANRTVGTSWVTLLSISIPGAAGYNVLIQGLVSVTNTTYQAGGMAGQTPREATAEIRIVRGSTQRVSVSDALQPGAQDTIPAATSDTHESMATFSLQVRASAISSYVRQVDATAASLLIFLAKR